VARLELTTTKTRAINQLRALLITGDAQDRQLNRPGQLSGEHLRRIIRRRAVPDESREQAIRRGEVRRLAVRIRDTVAELATNKTQLAEIVNDLAPGLLAKRGVGPVSAARAIAAWSHYGRCRNEAAFAALAGASPLEASSGRTIRHRLNRGGDRALNCALHSIVLTRWRCCPRTRAYIARRLPKVAPTVTSAVCSSATSRASSIALSTPPLHRTDQRERRAREDTRGRL
jgi:transposase